MDFDFPKTDLTSGFCRRYADLGASVQDCNGSLELVNLPFKAPRGQSMASKLDIEHFCIDAVSGGYIGQADLDRGIAVVGLSVGPASEISAGSSEIVG